MMSGDISQLKGPADLSPAEERPSPGFVMKVGPSIDNNMANHNNSPNDLHHDDRSVSEVRHDGGRILGEEDVGICSNIGLRYAQFVVRFPSLVLFLVLLGVVIAGGLGVLLNKFPSFDDPTEGHASLSNIVLKNFGNITVNWFTRSVARPIYECACESHATVMKVNQLPFCLNSSRQLCSVMRDPGNITKGFEARGTVISGRLKAFSRVWMHGSDQFYSCPSSPNSENDLCSRRVTREVDNQTLDDVRSCADDLSSRFRMVYRSTGSADMFTSASMKAVCQYDSENFRNYTGFDQICSQYFREDGNCCPSWSLGHMTALIVGKESCDDIDDTDVVAMKRLLEECVGLYSSGCLDGDGDAVCSDVPANCSAHSGVYTIFHYLTPTNFALQVTKGVFDLQTAMVLQPLYEWQYGAQTLYECYNDIPKLTNDAVQIVAIGGGFKFQLFAEYLLSDAIYIGIGCLAVVVIIWVYVGSFFVTIMTMVSIIMSMIVSYFLYYTIFRLVFFPFINVITAVLIIGVGADDCFVYVDIWKLTKKEHGGGRDNLVPVLRETLKHAGTTMFVTSFTTASALFAGCVSSITAVRCFSVFAGSSILVNFVLTVTWIPAAVMIHEKYVICDEEAQEGSCRCCGCWFSLGRLYDRVGRVGSKFFEEYLSVVIVKLRFLWILLLSGLGIGGFCVVFVAPRLRLPSQSEFQVFRISHVLEQYDQVYKQTFSFESESTNTMPAYIFWGIEPVDNGNHWDPLSEGSTVIASNFEITSPEAQTWLYDFCTDLRNASFHGNTASVAAKEFCFIDLFRSFMEGACTRPSIGDVSPCCGQTSFPYTSYLFNQCVPIFYRIVCQSAKSCEEYIPGLWFNSDNEVVGMVLVIQTSTQVSLDYNKMGQFWSEVNGFIEDRLAEAPVGLRKGWFISEAGLQMSFFDLQQGLATGTPLSVGLSLAFAACVLLITIRNVLVTIYAMYSIACAVFVVIASVVLLGWELNIFESTVLSLAVGLSVDFTIHLGVAYRQSIASDRTARSMHALRTLGAAITLAALTTFVAGACMLPATVLSYVQLGTFLMIVMAVSWVYGIFLFISLCRTIGPQGMFAQISRSCCRRDPNLPNNNLEMKPDEHVHGQHVDTSDEQRQP